MKKVLILGHKGMLGNAISKYLATKPDELTLLTTDKRYGNEDFKVELSSTDADFIINCIGLIPQRKPTDEEYKSLNTDLPLFLETLDRKIIHPSTDCEFSGKIPITQKYTKKDVRDAEDAYGKSKADSSYLIETTCKNIKIMRTSIVGHELNSHIALLDWFLNSEGEVRGYTNHYWNGITTLQWSKLCVELMNDWDSYPVLNQYGTLENKSKYEVLCIAKDVYGKEITITPFETLEALNKCVESDKVLPDLVDQLRELKEFYSK